MNSIVYLSIIGLLICNAYGRSIVDPENAVITADNDDDGYVGGQERVSISKAPPPKIIQKIGSSIELECEVSGSPPPRIQWVRGNQPIDNVSNFLIKLSMK